MRYEAYMDDVALSSLNPAIRILNIEPTEPQYNTNFANRANRDGAMIIRRSKATEGVQITLEIHEYNPQKREEIAQQISSWANGRVLKTSDRSGKRLRVVCDRYPIVTARDWTDPVTVVFTAYNLPHWEEDTPALLTLTGTSTSGQLFVPGNAGDALVEVSIKANAAATNITLRVGSTILGLGGLSLAANDTITIDYDDNLILRIRKGNTSILNKRTGADDLLARSGEYNTVEIAADGSVTATFSTRGLWH